MLFEISADMPGGAACAGTRLVYVVARAALPPMRGGLPPAIGGLGVVVFSLPLAANASISWEVVGVYAA